MDLQCRTWTATRRPSKLRGRSALQRACRFSRWTAHATIEERQRCLAAGMNESHFQTHRSGDVIPDRGRFYTPQRQPPGLTAIAFRQDCNDASRPGLLGRRARRSDGLCRVGGNRKLYLELLRQFWEQGPVTGKISARRRLSLVEQDLAHQGVRQVAALTVRPPTGPDRELSSRPCRATGRSRRLPGEPLPVSVRSLAPNQRRRNLPD